MHERLDKLENGGLFFLLFSGVETEGRKEGRKAGRQEGRKDGRKET